MSRGFGRDPSTYKGPTGPRARRTHCKAGHNLIEHGYPSKNGDGMVFTRCRECHVARTRARRAAERENAKIPWPKL